MALWALRWERYARDFEGLPPDERAVLDQEGIAIKDFLGCYESRAQCAEEVGPYAARMWVAHRSVAGASPESKRKCDAIMQEGSASAASTSQAPKAKAKLLPASSSGLRIFTNTLKPKKTIVEAAPVDELQQAAADEIYKVYVATGASGSKWLESPEGAEARRRCVILEPLTRRFDKLQLKSQLAFMRRWRKWCEDAKPPVQHLAPTPLDSAFFLQEHTKNGATVALGLFNNMKWWRKHVGVPFHCEHSAVVAFAAVAPGHVVEQKTPIDLEAILRLIKIAKQGAGTVHILLRASLLLTMSVVRFKHAQISKRTGSTDRMVKFFCPRGKRVIAGQQAPFEWAMPRFIDPNFDLAGPLLAILDQIGVKRGCEVDFVVPDVMGPLAADIHNKTPWALRPMPYEKWVKVLQGMPQMLGFDEAKTMQLWSTYTFRRLLPTIADIVGLHPDHRQSLGEWVEQVSAPDSGVSKAQPLMCHRYADCKVTTAGETKLMVASAIPLVAERAPQARTWEDLRRARISVADLDAYVSKDAKFRAQELQSHEVATEEERETCAEPLKQGDSSSTTSSSSDEEASDDHIEHVNSVSQEWFVQPGRTARAHLQKTISPEGKRISFCRATKPFFRYPDQSGDGWASAAQWQGGVCNTCLGQMPKDDAKTVLDAIFAAANMKPVS